MELGAISLVSEQERDYSSFELFAYIVSGKGDQKANSTCILGKLC